MRYLLYGVVLALWLHPSFAQQSGNEPSPEVTINGELKKWHKITLTFDGPKTDENHPYNPFLNYRLNVLFFHWFRYSRLFIIFLIIQNKFIVFGEIANTIHFF